MTINENNKSFQMGQTYHFQGNYDMAINFYKRALAEEPDNALVWWEMGMSYVHIGGMGAEAKACWEKAASMDTYIAEMYEKKKEESRKRNEEKTKQMEASK
jgi:tetratricopeptide (TPR) repeat protein